MLKRNTSAAVLVIVALAVTPTVAQESSTSPVPPTPNVDGELVTKIFKLQYADVRKVSNVLFVFGGQKQSDQDLGVIAWTGPRSQLPAIEAAIRSLDVAPVPEINVELTVYFLMATKEGPPSTSVPADLDGVAVQLQEVFGYTSVRLIEVTAIRVRNGSQGKINGILPQRLADDREARYEFFFDKLQVTEDSSGRSIRLDRLNAGVQAPHTVVEGGQATTRYMQTGIQTDIDLREGQKAVIGKTSIEGGAETVFVVVTGTIVD
jgi:hypothetical protein